MAFDTDRMIAARQPELPVEVNRLTERVIGCAMRVHTMLGAGMREKLYENALAIELRRAGIASERQVPFTVEYDGEVLGDQCVDLVVESMLIVECKGVAAVTEQDHAQLLGYLRFTGIPIGLLINFHTPRLKEGLYRKINWPTAPNSPGLVVRSRRLNSVPSVSAP